jgi:hypothetical protein
MWADSIGACIPGTGDPQSADTLVAGLDHAGRAAGDLAADLLHGLLTELLAPFPLVEVRRDAALSTRRLEHHVGEKPGIFGGSCP